MLTCNYCSTVQRTLLLVCLLLCTVPFVVAQESPGRPLTPSEVAKLDAHILPNGQGLPSGQGSVASGEKLYREHCAFCHGPVGEGANSVELFGDRALLTSEYPDKGIAVIWPYAPTLFEYIGRAMPPDSPGSFSAAELYSLVGYVLHLNNLLAANAVVDKSILSGISMPNRNGFTDNYQPE